MYIWSIEPKQLLDASYDCHLKCCFLILRNIYLSMLHIRDLCLGLWLLYKVLLGWPGITQWLLDHLRSTHVTWTGNETWLIWSSSIMDRVTHSFIWCINSNTILSFAPAYCHVCLCVPPIKELMSNKLVSAAIKGNIWRLLKLTPCHSNSVIIFAFLKKTLKFEKKEIHIFNL